MKIPLLIITTAASYYFIALLGLTLAFEQTNVSPVWPPSGLGLGLMLLFGKRVWPGITLGAFMVNVYVFHTNQITDLPAILSVSAIIATGNTLEALTGRYLYRSYIHKGLFSRHKNIFLFFIVALVMCLPGSIIGSVTLCIANITTWDNFTLLLQTWQMGDMAGVLTVTPLVLVWGVKRTTEPRESKMPGEYFLNYSLLIFICYSVFIQPENRAADNLKLYLVLPVLLWSAFRFTHRASVTSLFIVSLFAILGTVNGRGPFILGSLNQSLIGLEAFISVITISFMTIGALLSEQRFMRKKLEESQAILEQKVLNRTIELENTNEALLQESRERKKVDSYLHEAKESLNEACKIAKLGHWQWDVKENLLSWSDELFAIYGVDKTSFSASYTDFINRVHPDDRDFANQTVNNACIHKESFDYYHRILLDNGEIRWIHSNGKIIVDDDNEVIRMLGTALDVTESKEKEILHSYLASIVTHTSDAIISKSLDGKITSWNKGAEILYGYTKEEMIGQNISMIIPPERLKENQEVMNIVKMGEVVSYYETTRQRKNGSLIGVGITESPIKDIDEKIIGISVIARDITKFKEREEERFKLIVESAPNAMILVNQSGQIEFVNSQTKKMFGYNQSELVGQTLEILLPERYRDKHPKFRNQFNKTPVAREMGSGRDLYALHKDGHEIPVEIGLNPIETSEGVMVLSAIIDISERKKTEVARREKEVAEESVKMKDLFLSNMSHEIRTPLNAILGFTELLDTSALNEEQRSFLNAVKMSGQNLLHIINDILDFSKIEAGKIQLEMIPMYVPELLDTLQTIMVGEAWEKSLTLKIDTREDIHKYVSGDPIRLTQILVNLLSNAIKFTEKGSVSLLVRADQMEASKIKYFFSVEDTGIGIQPEKLDKIFDRFTQAESNITRKYGGTGLGLSIVKNLVDLHSGTINVESAPGQGSCFTVEITYELCAAPQIEDLVRARQVFREFNPGLIHILVAEDNHINQKLTRIVLEKMHFNVDIAENGREAVNQIQQKPYDLVLMDLSMPEMDGYQATQHIRQVLKLQTPIIAMTANAFPGVREKCLEVGMNDYITKPFKVGDLVEKIPGSIFSGPTKTFHQDKILKNTEMSITNLNYLRSLVGDNPEDINDFIDMFLQQAPEELEALRNAIMQSNYEEIGKSAHKMKSTVHNMGMEETAELLKSIQIIAQENHDLKQISSDYEMVKQHCALAIEELSQQ